MPYRGHYTGQPALPGDIVFKDAALMRYELDGWQVHDGFRGDFDPDAEYEAGDVVVRFGGLWIHTPEVEPDSWTCFVPPAAERWLKHDADRE
jgi:hypothetical protein